MTRSGSKKERLNSLTCRKRSEKIGDVTLSEFADSFLPSGKGRLRKSKNLFSRVQKISSSADIDIAAGYVNAGKEDIVLGKDAPEKANNNLINEGNQENNDTYSYYPLKIWLLVAEYISPEDVKSFSLICKNTLSVVNTPLFWIRLYKRYYRKVDLPKCLSFQCLENKKSLKQKVVRSLFYFYKPFVLTVNNSNYQYSYDKLVELLCLHQGTHSIDKQESDEEIRWLYVFKLCEKDLNIWEAKNNSPLHSSSNINYNPDDKCWLLKVICKEFILIPSVRGMTLRKIDCTSKTTILKFSSAPLSKMKTELGIVMINLEHSQKPLIIPWWHPDYWVHKKCCNQKPQIISRVL